MGRPRTWLHTTPLKSPGDFPLTSVGIGSCLSHLLLETHLRKRSVAIVVRWCDENLPWLLADLKFGWFFNYHKNNAALVKELWDVSDVDSFMVCAVGWGQSTL